MSSNNPANPCPNNVQELAARFNAAQSGSAALLWRFAISTLRYVEGNPKAKLTEIGAACADAVKRGKPYSKAWVSQVLKAARLFPKAEPKAGAEAAMFMDTYHGNVSKGAKAKDKASPEDRAKHGVSLIVSAVKAGFDADAARAALEAALANIDATADADESDESAE